MKNKSIEKVLKWFSMMEMKKLKEMENDPEWFSIMQNEKYKYPKTKKELFELKALYLCCFCNRVPKEISHIKNNTSNIHLMHIIQKILKCLYLYNI